MIHNTCTLRLAELTETDYFHTNARIEYITIYSHCIEQNGEHNGCIYSKTVCLKSHTQAESASSVICASVLLNFAGYTSRSSHTPSSLLLIAPLVHSDKSGLSIQHHVEVGLSCRETHRYFTGSARPCRTNLSVPSNNIVDLHLFQVFYWGLLKMHCFSLIFLRNLMSIPLIAINSLLRDPAEQIYIL